MDWAPRGARLATYNGTTAAFGTALETTFADSDSAAAAAEQQAKAKHAATNRIFGRKDMAIFFSDRVQVRDDQILGIGCQGLPTLSTGVILPTVGSALGITSTMPTSIAWPPVV